MYIHIFYTNVLKMLDEQGMTKHDLAERSGVSISFLSDLTNGKGNPSLKIMERIADALGTSLPLLLEATDMSAEDLEALKGRHVERSLPEGYERVSVVLPSFQAFQARQWSEAAQKRLRGWVTPQD